ncbi:hypothetical protein Fmac_013971 [Flemingia macrophylla]|uniref:Uncharacterized protein n=1 Tax=Flemingia macrophylla TaxID=520843 RepID=A0ABD1MAD7_9FABA
MRLKRKVREWRSRDRKMQQLLEGPRKLSWEINMSIEAMAMAGMDYKECGISLEEWDLQQHPLYLVVERHELLNVAAKAKIREWAKAVASCSKQEPDEQIICTCRNNIVLC